jgi:hypothetical protein
MAFSISLSSILVVAPCFAPIKKDNLRKENTEKSVFLPKKQCILGCDQAPSPLDGEGEDGGGNNFFTLNRACRRGAPLQSLQYFFIVSIQQE